MEADVERKICTGCKIYLPKTDFNWLSKAKNKQETKCRSCRAEEKKNWSELRGGIRHGKGA